MLIRSIYNYKSENFKTITDKDVISILSKGLLTITHRMNLEQVASNFNYANYRLFKRSTLEYFQKY